MDFFKQPAFDNPLLKNYTSDFQVLPPSILNMIKDQDPEKADDYITTLQALECPLGTVPIRRATEEDLMKENIASKIKVHSDMQ